MRGLASYLLAGIVVVLAVDFIASPVGLGLAAVVAWPAAVRSAPIHRSMPLQIVDRTHKGDRLKLPTNVGKQQTPPSTPAVMIGCDPAFSPLSTSARVNISGRCIAETAHPLAG